MIAQPVSAEEPEATIGPELKRFGDLPKRDLSSAFDAISEAVEAIRLAEQRTAGAERNSKQLELHYRAQVAALERRLASTEERIASAESRASEADVWCTRLRQAVETGFAGVLHNGPRT